MIFKLHYVFATSGFCALTILLGVFMETYTDASSLEVGFLLMVMPFANIIFRPIICSKADRTQAHQKVIVICLFIVVVSYSPFLIIPILGPDIYEVYPRTCFYVLGGCKIIGDIAFGGSYSIGDALAINYTERIGAKYGAYRIWGSLSWMSFGLLIGQINEVPFLPKYVPGFIILLTSSLLDMILIWLWPPEYFMMVPKSKIDRKKAQDAGQKQKAKPLMSKRVVLAHMKNKLLSVLSRSSEKTSTSHLPPPIIVNALSMTQKPTQQQVALPVQDENNQKAVETQTGPRTIDMGTQATALGLLLSKDLRIMLYLLYFVAVGSGMSTISFFFIGLSNVCHQEGTCDFSQLAGMLQLTMSCMETVLFFHVKKIENKIGRLNLCAFSLFFLALKYTLYVSIWFDINPYWAVLIESIHGISFGICLTMMVEMGHQFANEVEFILPELIDRGVVKEGQEADRLKLSLSATMQALVSGASDGIGRGFGALTWGYILGQHSFRALLTIAGIYMIICLIIIVCVIIFNKMFKPKLGFAILDENATQVTSGAESRATTEAPQVKLGPEFKEVDLA